MKIKAGEIWTLQTKILNSNRSKSAPVFIIYAEENDEECKSYSTKTGEVYNIGGHNERTNLQVVKAILAALKKPESLITYVADRI